MFWKNILQNNLVYYFLIISILIGTSLSAREQAGSEDPFAQFVDAEIVSPDSIVVIYPKDSQQVSSVDSTFILGHIKGAEIYLKKYNTKLFLNGQETDIHEDGGFIGFIPIEPGLFKVELRLEVQTLPRQSRFSYDIVYRNLFIKVPQPLKPVPFDSLKIAKELDTPDGFRNMSTGDRLTVQLQGTPDCKAWFSIDGLIDSIPMGEMSPRPQPYWGEAVFGQGAIPDSLLMRGIYSGSYQITSADRIDSATIRYHLMYPGKADILKRFESDSSFFMNPLTLHAIDDSTVATYESPYRVSINNSEYPFTVRFTDSVQTIRFGPRKGYFSIFQPEGVEALAVGSEGDWYICQLSATQKAFVYNRSVERLAPGVLPPHSYLAVIRSKSFEDKLQFEFPLSGKHVYRVAEVDRRTLKLQLFGVTTNTDWIRYDFAEPMIDFANWSQPEEGMYELTIKLNEKIWGYDSYYIGNTFYLDLIKPPDKVDELKGKTIVIDAGHSSDPGSIGTTGFTEAEANLALVLELEKRLTDKGVRVILTRSDTSDVPLYDRPMIAKLNNADLFISVHNNALPDGVNPFENNGSSTYYYHLHSIDFAKAVHKELVKATELRDYGLYHGNLAVNRPTQYPAILVECAFMIIPEQEAMLKTDSFRKKVAKGIIKGIEEFLKGYNND